MTLIRFRFAALLFTAVMSCITASLIPAEVCAQSTRSTAVLNIEAEGLDANTVDTLTSIVRSEAQQIHDYQVVDSTPVNLSEIVVLLNCSASSTQCLMQAASQLDAQVLIYGSLQQEGAQYRLRLEVFDAQEEQVTHRLQKLISAKDDLVVSYRRELEQFFRRVEKEQALATLSITSNVRGAQVSLNGEPLGTTPLERADIEPGAYTISVSKEGFSAWSVEVELEKRGQMSLRAPLKKQTSSPTARADASIPRPTTSDIDTSVDVSTTTSGGTNWGAWSLVTIGGLTLAGSGVMALLMQGVEEDLQSKFDEGTLTPSERDRLYDRGESYEFSHRVLLGVGLAGVGVGIGWLILGNSSETERASRVSIQAAPRGVSATVRW